MKKWLILTPLYGSNCALKRLGARKALLPGVRFIGSDLEPRSLEKARQNAARAGLTDVIEFRQGDATQLEAIEGVSSGVIVTNPPYGERLGDLPALIPLYAEFSLRLETTFSGLAPGGHYLQCRFAAAR